MGFIFQQSHLLKNLTIRDNIVLPGFKAGTKPREVVNQSAESLMKKMDITHIGHHDIRNVSGGQLQRAAICRALINNPDILFADEPTGALNSSASKEVMDILNGLNNEGTTIILVTHDAKVASRASRVVFIMDGNIKNEIQFESYDFDETDHLSREKKLGVWLEAQGF
jgi:putative ABC transport system ATP-binding protein